MSIQIYGNSALIGNKKISVIETDDGTIYFAAKEFAVALDYVNPNDAVTRLTRERMRIAFKDIEGVRDSRTPCIPGGLHPNKIFVTEPAAEEFQDWISEDVLPSIRKTGKYMLPGVMPAINNVKDEGLRQLPAPEKVEARDKLVCKSDIVKNQRKVESGRKGGLVAQENIRQLKIELSEKEIILLEKEMEILDFEEERGDQDENMDDLQEKVKDLMTEN
ncbi:Hypothetical predicted protein [Paramuricea clavata]|uniref:Uncharacterized protein n=1 Tax=Paramuricea clavata TaxID=317549 RepID=A0A6S7H5I0_PARCT|nr:Hypothetical predicted protein [Paramuricea clavata]